MTRDYAADPRLFVALDLPSLDEALRMVDTLAEAVTAYKIGLQLLPIGGAELGRALKSTGKTIFFDFKFHDIDATVEKAVRSVAALGVDFLTIHARPDIMRAAVKGRGDSNLKILGVTVLTSLDQPALQAIGYHQTPEALVLKRVEQAMAAGIDGVVASPLEAPQIRAIVPDDFLLVTPGVRLPGGNHDDQKRIATPEQALTDGASHLVIGRPITQASDPKQAALDIQARMKRAGTHNFK